ncbi:hypothetical protein [Marinovum sp. SP66]|nr:hypothetical protein [Marinovum sp. SP66]
MTRAPTAVIMSGDYSGEDICAEFGKLPPAFLPVGTRRLYEHQFKELTRFTKDIVLAIPADFELDQADQERLEREEVRILRVPIGLSLGNAVYFIFEVLQLTSGVMILLGDTLMRFQDDPGADTVSVFDTTDFYKWSEIVEARDGVLSLRKGFGDGNSPRTVASGFYFLSDAQKFRDEVCRGVDFDAAISTYSKSRPVALKRDAWLDFGHINTFYNSRKQMLVARYFNSLECDGPVLTKGGQDQAKLRAEARWFESLHDEMRVFAPAYLGNNGTSDGFSYNLEYLHNPTLAELHVFARLPRFQWSTIGRQCEVFLDRCNAFPLTSTDGAMGNHASDWFQRLIVDKSLHRVEAFGRQADFDIDAEITLNGCRYPSLMRFAVGLIDGIRPSMPQDMSFWHGDFFFGNILFDLRSSKLKAIDPRGIPDAAEKTAIGDWRYDMAKLCHSVFGCYDLILSDRMSFERRGPNDFALEVHQENSVRAVQDEFRPLRIRGQDLLSEEIIPMTALLFVAMLPLHAEDPRRQFALLANAYRFFDEYSAGYGAPRREKARTG